MFLAWISPTQRSDFACDLKQCRTFIAPDMNLCWAAADVLHYVINFCVSFASYWGGIGQYDPFQEYWCVCVCVCVWNWNRPGRLKSGTNGKTLWSCASHRNKARKLISMVMFAKLMRFILSRPIGDMRVRMRRARRKNQEKKTTRVLNNIYLIGFSPVTCTLQFREPVRLSSMVIHFLNADPSN